MTAERLDVRRVSGWGARCACGDESVLHLRRGNAHTVTPETSRFYCVNCASEAFDNFDAQTDREPYWPGDEGRDEPYVNPCPE